MPNGIRNWEYEDVVFFLDSHGFRLLRTFSGSHEQWCSEDRTKLVEVNKLHGKNSGGGYPPKTLQSKIDNSGYDRAHWFVWSALNKRGKKGRECCQDADKVDTESQ